MLGTIPGSCCCLLHVAVSNSNSNSNHNPEAEAFQQRSEAKCGRMVLMGEVSYRVGAESPRVYVESMSPVCEHALEN
jgi:hypothetical protein